MPNPKVTDDRLKQIVQIYRSENSNISAVARVIGLSRGTTQEHIRSAVKRGFMKEAERSGPNETTLNDLAAARDRKVAAFQKKQKIGAWDKPLLTRLPHQPFRLKIFGDPHLDADACDYELFERHWLQLDAANGVYGVCVGDWFNNWLRVLAHLWKHEGDPDDAWLLLEHLMEQRGDALIAACSGNHDDWSHGPVDPVDSLMKRHGVLYRKGAIRLLIDAGGAGPIRLAMRHKWRGHSMYSPAHALRRAASEGWEDHIMVGGHTHQDEPRMYVQPRSGFISHLCQVSAFKRYDDYADIHGFKPHAISPVWDLVVEPARFDTDPDKIKIFWDDSAAASYLKAIRN